jgi:hypothetical protein
LTTVSYDNRFDEGPVGSELDAFEQRMDAKNAQRDEALAGALRRLEQRLLLIEQRVGTLGERIESIDADHRSDVDTVLKEIRALLLGR